MSRLLEFFKISQPSEKTVEPEKIQRTYRKYAFQSFLAGTIGYSLYYVCRTTLNVVKQPIIDGGILDATQTGIVGSCLLFAYAIGKFCNGFMADYSNIKRFMTAGLFTSALMNLLMGILGASGAFIGSSNAIFFICFCVMWAINGWSQSIGSPCAVIALSRWFPLNRRGTFYGFFSASHNFGEWLSFLFVGLIVSTFGWKWGFQGAALAGFIGVALILWLMHDTPESCGLPPIQELTRENKEGQETAGPEKAGQPAEQIGVKKADEESARKENKSHDISKTQRQVIKNPGVWILAAASAFMYMSRYAINGWGILFLQKVKDFSMTDATFIISINAILGIIGTVFSGWISDVLFGGDRKYPAFFAGILETVALALFLFGGNGWFVNVLAMVLFGIAIGVLISFLGGLMAVDLVPREASGAALGIVGMASYAAAGVQDIISGILIDGNVTKTIVDGVTETSYDFGPVSWFWMAAAAISFLLPILNWKRKKA